MQNIEKEMDHAAHQSFIPTQVTEMKFKVMDKRYVESGTYQKVFQSLSRTPNQASYQHQAKTALEFDV
jgi:hypothetical protein